MNVRVYVSMGVDVGECVGVYVLLFLFIQSKVDQLQVLIIRTTDVLSMIDNELRR